MKKKLSTILIVIILLSGLSLLLFPTLSDFLNNVSRAKDINTYADSVAEIDDDLYRKTWDDAVAYNARLAKLPAHWKLTDDEMKEYDSLLDVAGRGIMSTVEIPKLGCSLPVYHGTSNEVLQIAIGHLEGSSLPVGGKSTHCVMSGHRGLPSAKLFTNLDKLVVGNREASDRSRRGSVHADDLHPLRNQHPPSAGERSQGRKRTGKRNAHYCGRAAN